MIDVASKGVEKHGVDKWSFRAFLVDNRGGRAQGEGLREGGVMASKRKLVLGESELEREVNGVRLSRVVGLRHLRVVDLFAGIGTVPFVLERLGVRAHVLEVEIDSVARRVAQVNNPSAVQGAPHDVWYWASEEGLERLIAMQPELLCAGFPCQSVSSAAPKG